MNWYALLIAVISGVIAFVGALVLVFVTGNDGKVWKAIVVGVITGAVAYAATAISVPGMEGSG